MKDSQIVFVLLAIAASGCDHPSDSETRRAVLLIATAPDGSPIPHSRVTVSFAGHDDTVRTDSEGKSVFMAGYGHGVEKAQVEGCPAWGRESPGIGLHDVVVSVSVIEETWAACRDPKIVNVRGPAGHMLRFRGTFEKWRPYPASSWIGSGGDSLRLDSTGKGIWHLNGLIHPFREETRFTLHVDGIELKRPQYRLSPSDTTFHIQWPPIPSTQPVGWSWPWRCGRTVFFVEDGILKEYPIGDPTSGSTRGRVYSNDSVVRIGYDSTGTRRWRIEPLQATTNGLRVDTGAGPPMYCATQPAKR